VSAETTGRIGLARVGLAVWTAIGAVILAAIALAVLGATSEIAIPVLLGAIVAVVIKPLADRIARRGVRPSAAAGVVIAGLLVVVAGATIAVVVGLVEQQDEISASIDDAVSTASDEFEIDTATLTETRDAVEALAPLVGAGAVTTLISGVSSIVGFVSGFLLALIVMYYLVKDGARLRSGVLGSVDQSYRDDLDDFIGESCATLRNYAQGRTMMSAIVTAVMGLTAWLLGLPLVLTIMAVTFIGGYIPYIGAFVAGAFTVLVALGDGGVTPAIIVLVVSLAANLLLENFVEPRVMGKSLSIHPLVVLIVTALGGLLGGIIGLMIAVPLAVIGGSAISRLRSSGHLERAAERARPTAEKFLGVVADRAPEPDPSPGTRS
jgi:predicted PurR-regulated permease PerM